MAMSTHIVVILALMWSADANLKQKHDEDHSGGKRGTSSEDLVTAQDIRLATATHHVDKGVVEENKENGLVGNIQAGWCPSWREGVQAGRGFPHSFNGSESQTQDECFNRCINDDSCTQAVFESNGPWGQECWLGNGTRSCTPAPAPTPQPRGGCRQHGGCADACYLKSSYDDHCRPATEVLPTIPFGGDCWDTCGQESLSGPSCPNAACPTGPVSENSTVTATGMCCRDPGWTPPSWSNVADECVKARLGCGFGHCCV